MHPLPVSNFGQLTVAVWRVALGRILRLCWALWDPLWMSFPAKEREGQHASVIPVQPRASLTLEAEIKGWDGQLVAPSRQVAGQEHVPEEDPKIGRT